jgi:plastocyanin
VSSSTHARAVVLSLIVLAASDDAIAAARPATATHTVTIENMAYTPRMLTIRRGDTIVWVNRDLFPHTVTGSGFDSRSIAPSQTWAHVGTVTGRVDYRCTLHPTMTATVLVR